MNSSAAVSDAPLDGPFTGAGVVGGVSRRLPIEAGRFAPGKYRFGDHEPCALRPVDPYVAWAAACSTFAPQPSTIVAATIARKVAHLPAVRRRNEGAATAKCAMLIPGAEKRGRYE